MQRLVAVFGSFSDLYGEVDLSAYQSMAASLQAQSMAASLQAQAEADQVSDVVNEVER